MRDATSPDAMAVLALLIGTWRMLAGFAPDAPDAPDAADGLAVIGFDSGAGVYRQHYFDARGVARLYDMTFADGVWTLERHAGGPDFSQRFTGHLDSGGTTIAGRWEIARHRGAWEDDFDPTCTRIGSPPSR